jgi:hypothetical protein
MQALPSVAWSDATRDGDGKPKEYVLEVYLPRPYHSAYSDQTIWYYGADGKQQRTAELTLKGPAEGLPGNTPVTLMLFVWRNTGHGQRCQFRAAHAVVRFDSLAGPTKRIELVNLYDKPQAVLTLASLRRTIPVLADSKRWQPLTFAAPLTLKEMRGGLKSNGLVPRAFRRSNTRHIPGSVPVWMMCNLYECDSQSLITESYLRETLGTAVRVCGFASEQEWMKTPETDLDVFEVLAQVCTWVSKFRPYLFDKTWEEGKGWVTSDQFSVLEAAPSAAEAAGDCEDSSKSVMRVFSCLSRLMANAFTLGGAKPRRLADTDPLRYLIRMAKGYCGFIVDASINVGSKKELSPNPARDKPSELSLHMFVLLQPWSVVARLLRAEDDGRLVESLHSGNIRATQGWPTLVLEGTEPCRGSTRADYPGLDRFIGVFQQVARTLPDKMLVRRFKLDATINNFENTQFYRQVICMYSPYLFRRFNITTLLACRKTHKSGVWTFGASAKQWFFSDGKPADGLALCVLHRATKQERRTFESLCSRMPILAPLEVTKQNLVNHVRVQVDGTEVARTVERDAVFRVYMRAIDWTAEGETQVLEAVKRDGRYALAVGRQQFVVQDGFEVVMYQFAAAK